MALHRRFTPLTMLLISINGMIGSAWLFAPLYAAKIAGAASIVAWLLGGTATALIALTFAEISAFMPTAGGTTRVPELSHGGLTSFTMSWLAWISCITMPPIEVQAVLQYASTYFPSLTLQTEGEVHALSSIGLVWATVLMAGLCVLNIASFKGLVYFNQLLFLCKTSIILLTVMMLMKTSFSASNFDGISAVFSVHGWKMILTALASGGVAFAFTGFKHGIELAGETKNTHFAIPLAVIGSVLCCLVLYIGLQVAFIGALAPEHLQAGWENIHFAGDAGPFVGIAMLLGLLWLVKLLYLDAIVSPLGAGLIYVTSTSRIVYAMSKLGYVPGFLSHLNKQHFPVYAIALNFVIGMVLFLPLPGWQTMVSFLVSAMVLSYAMGPVALLCLRKEVPDEPRPFRLPFAKMLCLVAFYCCNLISYWTGWETLSKLAVAVGIGAVFFLIAYVRQRIAPGNLGVKAALWIVPYFTGLMLISYLGAFGGKNFIPFGWDFLVIALFSAVMLVLAVNVRLSNCAELYALYKEEHREA